MYTIEDLKNGKCAVRNDGTVEELNKVLAHIEWPFYVHGTDKYYWKSSSQEVECNTTKPPIPTQSVKDFIKQLDKGNKLSEIKEKEFTFSEDDIPSDFPYHPYVLDQGIQERCRQYKLFIRDGFEFCIKNKISYWFDWECSINGREYWKNIYFNTNFIPENYTPKYFKSRQSKLPLDGIPLCGVIDSEYQPLSLTQEKRDFTIPASYMEVELTIKKPICKF